jgi:fluoride exporter
VAALSSDDLQMRSRRSTDVAAIAVGGAVGTVLRIACGELWPVGSGIPWTTLAVNVAGAAMLGVVAALPLGAHGFAQWRFPLLATGLCGALTTFSGLCWEMLDLIDRGHTGTAAMYAALSLCLGLVAMVCALNVTERSIAGRGRQ